ncbi:MAG TPA: 2-oxoacid:acceptor oxidoreductase subunit alpha, partial [Soehngenia sp.]|nr:2-oxoacid:acceptor oxidoreductase subunit alpha [Soehngenia sp.]
VGDNDIVPEMAAFGEGYRYNVTGLVHDETGFPSGNEAVADKLLNRLINKIENNKDDIVTYEEYMLDDADYAIVSFGAISRSSKVAVNTLRELGIKIGMFRPITIWPSPEKQLFELSKKVKKIYVVELNAGQYLLEVQRIASGQCDIGKYGKINGEIITPQEIVSFIKEDIYA